MKTIIYVGGDLPDKSPAAHRVYSNGKALRDYGFNLVFLGEDRNSSSIVPYKTTYNGFDIWFSKYSQTSCEWIEHITNRKDIRTVIEAYRDVVAVVYYDPSAIALLKLKFYCKKRKIVLLADCTEWHTTTHLSGIKRIVKLLDINFTLRFIQKIIDGLIVISSFFEKYYKEKKAIKIIPLVDKSDVKWNISSAKINKDTTKFVYAGNMGNEKDRLNNIIYSLNSLSEFSFTFKIVGITKDDYLKKFPNDIKILEGLNNRVSFLGRMEHTEVLEHVKNAHFSFLIRENNRKNNAGFPTKFAESITCGTPVIASNFSDVKEYVEKYNLGIMIDGLDSISDGLRKAITMDNSEYAQLRNSCLNCNIFDYRNYVNQLGEFIDKIVEEKNERK